MTDNWADKQLIDFASTLPEEVKVDVACIVCGKKGKISEWLATKNTYCKECADKKKQTEKDEKERSGVITRLGGLRAYTEFTLEKFTNKIAVEKCGNYPDENYFLWGASGTGKTHLATALVRRFEGAKVVKPQHIYRACRGIKNGEEEQALINSFATAPYLVIDDLGADKKTEFSYSTLYEIIDARWMNYRGGLIITSNLSLSNLAEKIDDDRVVSRLCGMCRVIELTGPDKRNNQTKTGGQ